MNLHGIDHVELYVGDARQSAYYFCTAFGFRIVGQGGPETGLPGQRSLLLRHGDVRMVLTSGLTADHPATRYVARHGDGVAVVAFGTDDAAAAYERITARGAAGVEPPVTYPEATGRVVTATVSGFGDVLHRLVQRDGTDEFLPGAFAAVPAGVPSGPDAGPLFDVIDHVAVCVPAGTLARTTQYYEEAFGFSQIFAERIEVGGQAMDSTVVQSPSQGVTFTLIEPDPTCRPGQIDDFLRWHAGAGVQHLAFRTRDIVAAIGALGGRGVGFLATPDSYYLGLAERFGGEPDVPLDRLQPLGVLVDRDHFGELFQIFTQSMHVRRTLFLELIERRGALTFGSGNIKALYEAKARELTGTRDTAPAAPATPVTPAVA